jgi:hypothetical protein
LKMKKVIAIFAIAALTACGGAETPAETVSPAAETGTPTPTAVEGTPTPTAEAGTPTPTAAVAKDAKKADAKKADAPKEEKKK